MKTVAIFLVTVASAFAAGALPLRGADTPAPAAKPAAAIIITNKTDGSTSARTPYLSAGLPEIVRMHKAGVDASVLLAFAQNSPVAYHASAKEIIYLRDQGLSSEIISALLRRGGELHDRAAEAQREEKARATSPPAVSPAAPAPPQAAAPAPVVVYANTTSPVYTSPTYVPHPSYNYASPAYDNYSYGRPYYRSSYYYPSVYAGYRSGCYPSYGLSVGFGGGRFSFYGGGYRHGGRSHCRR